VERDTSIWKNIKFLKSVVPLGKPLKEYEK
jgi:hypothetical protein